MRRLTLAEPWTVNVAGLVRSACSRLGTTCLLSLLLLPSAATHHGNNPYEVIQGRSSKERVLPTGPTIGSPRIGVPAVATNRVLQMLCFTLREASRRGLVFPSPHLRRRFRGARNKPDG